jgi:hypothetical protein
MTPVKPQISKFKGRRNLANRALTCYGGSTHERLLSESSRPYMLAYYLSALVVHVFSVMSCRENSAINAFHVVGRKKAGM